MATPPDATTAPPTKPSLYDEWSPLIKAYLAAKGSSQSLPSPSQDADIAAYVLTGLSAYEGLSVVNPTLAFYLGLAAAGAYALANRLSAYGY